MGRHIVITAYFADEGFQKDLADPEIAEHLDYYLEHPSYKRSHEDMEKRRSEAMEDIDLYINIANDGETYTTQDKHGSECYITLPKKADLDAGLLALTYHLFQRDQIVGFTVMHTGA